MNDWYPGKNLGTFLDVTEKRIPVPGKEKDPCCFPTVPCTVETPWGTVKGLKCPVGEYVYHNTIVEKAVEIASSGVLKVGQQKTALGQDVVSLSGCPRQTYGGNIKLVFTNGEGLRPMCYYEYTLHQHIDRGVEKEARQPMNGEMLGANRIRAKYGINLTMYKRECEYVSDHDIVLADKLVRVEYWIPWKIERYSYSHACEGVGPRYANCNGSEHQIAVMMGYIAKTKEIAETYNIPFRVDCCFSALKASWGDVYIPLTEENFKLFAKGIIPEKIYGPIPTECKC